MKLRGTRLAALALALLLGAVGVAGCGEKSEEVEARTFPFSVTLDLRPDPDHAGIYMARKLGYFEDAGLEVEIETPTDPDAPVEEVAAGRTDLAISREPEVMLARERGLEVIAVGAIVDSPLTSMIWLRGSGIEDVAGLRGRTIATAGIPYQDAYLKTILGRADLGTDEVKTVDAGDGLLPALLGGRAQATLGGSRNVEGVDLELRGRRPVVTPVDRLGVPTYDELVLVGRRDLIEAEPEATRLFLAALARGTAAAGERPRAAAEALLEANPDLDPRTTRAEVEATLPLLSTDGRMDAARWREFIAWMRDSELIADLPATDEVLTNEYLPGEIPE